LVFASVSPLLAEHLLDRPAAARAAERELRARLWRETEHQALRRLAPAWDASALKEAARADGAEVEWREIAAAAEAATAKPL
jgi:hypothetical protein